MNNNPLRLVMWLLPVLCVALTGCGLVSRAPAGSDGRFIVAPVEPAVEGGRELPAAGSEGWFIVPPTQSGANVPAWAWRMAQEVLHPAAPLVSQVEDAVTNGRAAPVAGGQLLRLSDRAWELTMTARKEWRQGGDDIDWMGYASAKCITEFIELVGFAGQRGDREGLELARNYSFPRAKEVTEAWVICREFQEKGNE